MNNANIQLDLQRPSLLRESSYIGGEWTPSAESLEVINPATGTVLSKVANAGAEEALAAVAAAHEALRSWQLAGASERARLLRTWHDLMLLHKEDLARIMSAEQGKPLSEARGEVIYAANFLAWFAEEARRVYGDIIPGHSPDKRLAVLRQPVGVVSAITPWNFPLAMITRKAGPALAAGCSIVVKPSELTPLSALALAALAHDAGIPPGVFNVVVGDPTPIGDVFVEHPTVRKFSFTGSTAVGKSLAARCMSTVKRVSLELGGNAPFIVFEDADLDAAVDGAVAAKFRNAGQTCVSPNRFVVHEDVREAFAQALAKRVSRLRVGHAFVGDPQIGPLINEAACSKVEAHVRDALGRGARLLAGGERSEAGPNFFQPTVLTDVTRDALLCHQETFGPVAAILAFRTEEEAILLSNDSSAGLAAYVYTRDLSRSHRVGEALEYGMVGMNTGMISTEVAPFGGIKQSGVGREGSRFGIDDYVSMKLICTSVEGRAL